MKFANQQFLQRLTDCDDMSEDSTVQSLERYSMPWTVDGDHIRDMQFPAKQFGEVGRSSVLRMNDLNFSLGHDPPE